MNTFRRHGDVNLHPATQEEYEKFTGKVVKHTGNYIVARGEATGSTHNVKVGKATDMEIKEDGEIRMVKLLKEAQITHTHDHAPLIIAPGYYIQIQERELDWFNKGISRKVID